MVQGTAGNSFVTRVITRMPAWWCTQALPPEDFTTLAVYDQKPGHIQQFGAALLRGSGTQPLPLPLETKALSCFCAISHPRGTELNLYLVRALVYRKENKPSTSSLAGRCPSTKQWFPGC